MTTSLFIGQFSSLQSILGTPWVWLANMVLNGPVSSISLMLGLHGGGRPGIIMWNLAILGY